MFLKQNKDKENNVCKGCIDVNVTVTENPSLMSVNIWFSHESLLGGYNLFFMVAAVCLRGMENNMCVHVPYVLLCACQRICLCVMKPIYDA